MLILWKHFLKLLICEDKSHTFAFTISSSPECVDTVNSFLVDTGATAHILNDKSLFSSFESSFEPEKHSIVFAMYDASTSLCRSRS